MLLLLLLKRQSEHSGLRPDTSSLVGFLKFISSSLLEFESGILRWIKSPICEYDDFVIEIVSVFLFMKGQLYAIGRFRVLFKYTV